MYYNPMTDHYSPEDGGGTDPGQQNLTGSGQQNPYSYSDYVTSGPDGSSSGQQLPEKKKRSKAPLIAVCAAAAAVIVALVLKFVVFASPNDLIVKACKATFQAEDDPLAGQIKKIPDVTKDGEFSASGTVVIPQGLMGTGYQLATPAEDFELEFDYDQAKGGQSAEFQFNYSGRDYDIKEALDDKTLTLSLDGLYSAPLQYPYTTDKSDSAFAEMVGGSESLDLADQAIKAFYSLTQKGSTDTAAILEEHFKELDFKRAGSREIGGEKCRGYSATLTEDWARDLYDDMLGAGMTDEIKNLLGTLQGLGSTSFDADFSAVDHCRITYYVGKGKLRGIEIVPDQQAVKDSSAVEGDSGEADSVLAVFKGEDVPWYQTEITGSEGGKVTLDVSKDGDQMVYTLSSDENGSGALKYKSGDGSFSIESDDQEILSGTILAQDDSAKIEGQITDQTSGESFRFGIDLSGTAEILKIDGTPADITTWTQDDWSQFVAELGQTAYSY